MLDDQIPAVFWCLSLEWGLGFGLVAVLVVLILLAVLVVVLWKGGGALIVRYGDFSAAGTGKGVLSAVVVLLLIAAVGYGIYVGFKGLKQAYLVALNTPGRELGQVRNDFQSETHLVINVMEPAKKFVISGSYQGTCVADLFHAICRQYSDRINCESSFLKRTLTVDLRKPL